MTKRIVIAGGGAAGFFAAIAAAEADPQARVDVLEKSPELLAKVSISGGGRCNVTHHCFEVDRLVQHYPRGAREMIGPFHRFQPRDTVQWFESRGVPLKVEADGRMFPVTDRSSSIVQCLLRAAREAGVRIHTGRGLRAIRPRSGGGFDLDLTTGDTIPADRLLLATGGNKATAGYRLAVSVGHTIEPPVPSLFTFNVPDESLHALAGIAAPNAVIRAPRERVEQIGPILITHWGLSGPAALKLSAWGARAFAEHEYRAELLVNWQRDGLVALKEHIAKNRAEHPARTLAASHVLDVPARFWEWLCCKAEIPPDRQWSRLSKAEGERLIETCTASRFTMNGKSIYKDEFVTCGGVRLSEVNFKTMESKCCPGLYLAGELLDIDAVTGGFNFQAAWTTGWIAGQAMASA